jgi:hypothetical protein
VTYFAAGETVSLLRRAVTGQDADGVDIYGTTTVTITNCVTYPRQSSEAVYGRDTVIVGRTLIAPYGTVINPVDRFTLADGLTYEVDGVAGVWSSPFTGYQAGVEVALKRVTG